MIIYAHTFRKLARPATALLKALQADARDEQTVSTSHTLGIELLRMLSVPIPEYPIGYDLDGPPLFGADVSEPKRLATIKLKDALGGPGTYTIEGRE